MYMLFLTSNAVKEKAVNEMVRPFFIRCVAIYIENVPDFYLHTVSTVSTLAVQRVRSIYHAPIMLTLHGLLGSTKMFTRRYKVLRRACSYYQHLCAEKLKLDLKTILEHLKTHARDQNKLSLIEFLDRMAN